jgi:hypothetical protein
MLAEAGCSPRSVPSADSRLPNTDFKEFYFP